MTFIHLLRAELELVTPSGVTAPESLTIGSVLSPDLPLARDGWGTPGRPGSPYVPGTSIAGSLRHQAEEERRPLLFGDITRETKSDGTPGDTTATASPVWVLGTQVVLPDDTDTQVRRHTAVNRHRAAAQERTLHSRELLPPGTTLLVWLRLDSEHEQSLLLDEVVALLSAWRPYIGRSRTTGHGQAQLLNVKHRPIDLTDPEGLRHWLLRGGPDLVDEHSTEIYRYARQGGPTALPHLFGQPLRFRVVDALHIGNGGFAERTSTRSSHSTILRDHLNRPVVPGSTWKGLLRGRCEFILRSVGIPACASVDDGTCGQCVVCESFGWTRRGGARGDAAGSAGARGRLLFTDSTIHEDRTTVRHHVPLDRVFGGARDHTLFAEEAVEGGALDLTIRVDGTIPESARAALLLALRDLADGRLGVGGGTTRGYGTLAPDAATDELLTAHCQDAMRTLSDHRAALHTSTTPEEVLA